MSKWVKPESEWREQLHTLHPLAAIYGSRHALSDHTPDERVESAIRNLMQEVNALARAGDMDGAQELLRDAARAQTIRYRQYDGKWDDYVIHQQEFAWRGKGGVRVPKGDWVLVKDSDENSRYSPRTIAGGYSNR